tara:strand:- start:1929 stop:2996 length:1068 start_codon:yes stop_codon:yes gene_type:complete
MSDFYEIDFLGVGTSKSGDAITMRYKQDGEIFIHVVDGGYQSTGETLVAHIREHYDDPSFIDHVVVTHPDGDHCGGLRSVLEEFDVGTLWMICPWYHTDNLIHRFSRFTNKDNLAKRLREIYPNVAALEEIAREKRIDISAPFQGAEIGPFRVLSPTYDHFLDLVEQSEKTPEGVTLKREETLFEIGLRALAKLSNAVWGEERFSENNTSSENEMSVVQWMSMLGEDVVLTGDAGREALHAAADYAPMVGLNIPGVTKIQVPHHGSRRNVDAAVLDRWLGRKMPSDGKFTTSAYVSAAKGDKHHPKNAVKRAFMHRGARVFSTENRVWIRTGRNMPERSGSVTLSPELYPDTQEE